MSGGIVEKLRAAQRAAHFSDSDMARWFCRDRATIANWLEGRYKPQARAVPSLEQHLAVLNWIVANTPLLPIPLSVTQFGRGSYITEVKDAFNAGTIATCSPRIRSTVRVRPGS